MKKQKIAVFCGSKEGKSPLYMDVAREVGTALGREGRTLLFGGCDYGLMQAVSRAAFEKGGSVHSFRIRGLTDAYAPEIISYDEILPNVQLRKRRLIEASDACIVLPGGFGTLDELSDVLSMTQLQDVRRPLGILNINGFFDGLIALADTMNREGFLSDADRALLIVRQDIPSLLEVLDEA